MHKNLIIAAFEKAKAAAQEEGITNPSIHRLSNSLSDYLSDDVGFSFSSKSLRIHYNLAKSLIDTTGDINITQPAVINGLCSYLDYESYQAFLEKNKEPIEHISLLINSSKNQKPLPFIKKYKTALLFVLSTVALATIIIKTNQQRWMKWNGETYEEAAFEPDSLQHGVLQLYSKERVNAFNKLPNCDCDTDFFNPDGSVKVWYSKNKDGTLNCFNSPGLHPETGKTLKPITVYMIRKYLCEGY